MNIILYYYCIIKRRIFTELAFHLDPYFIQYIKFITPPAYSPNIIICLLIFYKQSESEPEWLHSVTRSWRPNPEIGLSATYPL